MCILLAVAEIVVLKLKSATRHTPKPDSDNQRELAEASKRLAKLRVHDEMNAFTGVSEEEPSLSSVTNI